MCPALFFRSVYEGYSFMTKTIVAIPGFLGLAYFFFLIWFGNRKLRQSKRVHAAQAATAAEMDGAVGTDAGR